MIARSVQNYTSFWGQWTLASAAGFAIGGMLSLPIAFGIGELVMEALNEMDRVLKPDGLAFIEMGNGGRK